VVLLFITGFGCGVAYWFLVDLVMRPAEKIGVPTLTWIVVGAAVPVLFLVAKIQAAAGWCVGIVALFTLSMVGPFFGWTYLSQGSFERSVQLDLPAGTRGFHASIRASFFHSEIDAEFEIPRTGLQRFVADNHLNDGYLHSRGGDCDLPASNWTRGGAADLDNPEDMAEMKRMD
jgi:hypothetical protein